MDLNSFLGNEDLHPSSLRPAEPQRAASLFQITSSLIKRLRTQGKTRDPKSLSFWKVQNTARALSTNNLALYRPLKTCKFSELREIKIGATFRGILI